MEEVCNIIEKYKEYQKIINNTILPEVKCLVMINRSFCDICDRIKVNQISSELCIRYNEGIQICQTCKNKYPLDLLMYNISIKYRIITWNQLKNILTQVYRGINFSTFNIIRSNGTLETWKGCLLNPCKITKKHDIKIYVTSLDDKYQKSIFLSEIFKINNLDFSIVKPLIKTIY